MNYKLLTIRCKFICSISVLFGDHAVAEKILTSKDPRAQKSLGRKVKNFDEAVWTGECFNIVKRGNRAKVITEKISVKTKLILGV